MFSMSSAFTSCAALPKSMVEDPLRPSSKLYRSLVIGIPFTTNNGWLLPIKEVAPLIVMFAEAAGPAEEPVILTPEILPARALITFGVFTLATSEPLIP